MIRLLALDIDGTLLDSDGRVPDAHATAVARAIAAGVTVVLATGRRFDFARPILERLPAPLTLILSNGAIVKTRDGDTLARPLLTMLEFAGRPVLMASALPELKARGWAVTSSNDAEGVARAIETFVLRETSN